MTRLISIVVMAVVLISGVCGAQYIEHLQSQREELSNKLRKSEKALKECQSREERLIEELASQVSDDCMGLREDAKGFSQEEMEDQCDLVAVHFLDNVYADMQNTRSHYVAQCF